jgi:hypothetical protein
MNQKLFLIEELEDQDLLDPGRGSPHPGGIPTRP